MFLVPFSFFLAIVVTFSRFCEVSFAEELRSLQREHDELSEGFFHLIQRANIFKSDLHVRATSLDLLETV